MGLLENQNAYDPIAVKLYKGKDKPASRGFAEPKLNMHMFASQFGLEINNLKLLQQIALEENMNHHHLFKL